MLEKKNISEEIRSILTEMDPAAYPETFGYLASVLRDDGTVGEQAYILASELMGKDKPKKFPKNVIALVTELYEEEIENGNADAMNDLGAQYYDGSRGFEQSFENALAYYTMAAENGSRQAQENLGYCYYYGRNTPVDYEKAFHFFALGAFDGHLISLYKIGDMYRNGYYVKKNEKEAFLIYQRCIETMTDEAAPFVAGPVFLRLGNAFLSGQGVKENTDSALVCFQKAEVFLYDMVRDGNFMYAKSLREAIEGQEKARKKRMERLSSD